MKRKQTLLEKAKALEPEKPYLSRSGWDSYPIEETLDLAIAYSLHKVSATNFCKVLSGREKATNVPYAVGLILGKALRMGMIRKVRAK